MNELVTRQQEAGLVISTETKELIQSSIAGSTLKRYRRLSKQIETWLGGQMLTDARLADYITALHTEGKSPATIAQAVAAAKWLAKNHGIEIVGEVTSKTLAGIRREGKERGHGQVDGVEREEMLRVVTLAEADKTIAGLRDAVLIRLMSDCLLRISEAVAVDVGDLHKNTLRIKSSKTDQDGRGEVLFVGGPTLKLIDRYCTRAEIQSGALFRHIRRGDHVQSGRLTTVSARRIIQARAKAAGVEGFHQWSFAQGRQCCLARPGGGFGGRYAECGQVEVATDAGALCQSGAGGTGSGRKVLLWERDGVIEMRGFLDFACFACGVIVIGMALVLISVGITGALSVTIVIVQIGSLLAVFFAVLRIERKKISWVNKYQRGFYRLWMAFSSLLGIAVIIAWLAENLDVERLVNEGRGFGNWAMRSLFCLLWRASRLVSLFPV